MSDCRSCGARILWARHELTGKSLPLDFESTPTGNIRLEVERQTAHYMRKDELAAVDFTDPIQSRLYKSHFATCPNAKQHRKAKR